MFFVVGISILIATDRLSMNSGLEDGCESLLLVCLGLFWCSGAGVVSRRHRNGACFDLFSYPTCSHPDMGRFACIVLLLTQQRCNIQTRNLRKCAERPNPPAPKVPRVTLHHPHECSLLQCPSRWGLRLGRPPAREIPWLGTRATISPISGHRRHLRCC